MNDCVSGRLRGPGPNEPSAGVIGKLESLELIGEAGVEPDAAGTVHRPGEDHQRPMPATG